MPDGLELEEGGDVVGALPVRFAADHALHVLRPEALELGGVAVAAGEVQRGYVHMRREPRRELLAPRLHHLGDAVEHLTAVVGRGFGPADTGLARDAHRVAEILARRARYVRTLGDERAT